MFAQRFDKFYNLVCKGFLGFAFVYWFGEHIILYLDYLIAIPWFFYIVPLIILSIAYSLIIKKVPYLGIAVIIFIGLPFIINFNPTENLKPHTQESFRICSLNTNYFFGKGNPDLGLPTLKDQECDVYMLQELWSARKNEKTIREKLAPYFPSYSIVLGGEFAILSKYPILSTNLGPHEGYFKAVIQTQQSTRTVFNVHIWNPLITRACQSFEAPLYSTNCELNAQQIRIAQSNELLNELPKAQNQVFVAGDFNSMQNMKVLQQMSTLTHEVGLQAIGLNGTFSSSTPVINIDHIFVSNDIPLSKMSTKEICSSRISDHCMLIFQLD